ncbi:acyltransferase [Conexibacter sp. SYSU D00693]|uniref:acyltransferase family protein n=1 Tax=Conexibacter sp. SYSU D00693 TaxID=2812560 RepID=UPI00196ACD86|nr:acyltransferase [Conexibacter sp. SYSU D00693]
MAAGGTATAPQGAGHRLDALDGLRGLTALGIVVLHVWMYVYGDLGKPDKTFTDVLIGELRIGVPVFFALSGFFVHRAFVAASLDGRPRPHLGHYALRRAARILPAYWVAVLGAFLLLSHLAHPMGVTAGELPVFLLLAQEWFPETAKQLDPPMWTLGVELTFYALLPLVALVTLRLARRGQALVCGGVVAAGVGFVAWNALAPWNPVLDDKLPVHLAEFGAGMLVATLTHGRQASRRTGRLLLGGGLALVALNAWWHGYAVGPQTLRDVLADQPAVLGIAMVIASYALVARRARLLAGAPARWAGKLSYGTYLAHYLVIFWLRTTDRWPETLGGALVAVFAITLPLALLSWVVVEQPAIRWAAARTTRGRRTASRTHPRTQARPATA